ILLLIILILFIIIYLINIKYKKTKESLFEYLNYATFTIIILNVVLITSGFGKKEIQMTPKIKFDKIDKNIFKPNIYFILFDGFAGKKSLQQFGLNNDWLYDSMRKLNYYMPDSFSSNYNITIASLNSILNMNYIDEKKLLPVNQYGMYLKSFKNISDNNTVRFFEENNYDIYNLSFFDFEHQQKFYHYKSVSSTINIVHHQFFHNRLIADLGWKLYSGKYSIFYFYKKLYLNNFYNNNAALEKCKLISQQRTIKPKFVYLHLLMPHAPYYTDSLGKLKSQKEAYNLSTDSYLNYLKHASNIMLETAKNIKLNDTNAIIIFLSDHGYHEKNTKKLMLDNIMAIFLPKKINHKKESLIKIKSAVQLFPVLLNECFDQKIEVPKESFYNIDEINNKFIKL
nr:sulfatase-like hydrolase/transferase [Chitinophagaceae bacterium]